MYESLKRKLPSLTVAIAVGLLAGGVSIALASLTFTGTNISGNSGVSIDSSSTISIGTSTATTVMIGNASGTLSLFGNIGIGTAVPSSTLHVIGSIQQTAVTSSLLAADANGKLVATTTSGGASQWTTTSTGIFYNGGNVTIGTPLPTTIGNAGVLVPVVISTSGPVAVAATGFYINNASGALTYTLPTITSGLVGMQFCFRNAVTRTGAITLTAPASTYIELSGAVGTVAGTLVSGGALGDSACVVAVDTTHYYAYVVGGVWVNN